MKIKGKLAFRRLGLWLFTATLFALANGCWYEDLICSINC